MSDKNHNEIHKELHENLDELLADFITQHPERRGILKTPIKDLIEWSHKQAEDPDHRPCKITRRRFCE